MIRQLSVQLFSWIQVTYCCCLDCARARHVRCFEILANPKFVNKVFHNPSVGSRTYERIKSSSDNQSHKDGDYMEEVIHVEYLDS